MLVFFFFIIFVTINTNYLCSKSKSLIPIKNKLNDVIFMKRKIQLYNNFVLVVIVVVK